MKKILSLLLMLFMSVGMWAANEQQTVELAYTGTTTTNMTGENDAAIVGLDASEWSVIGNKGGSDYFPGLNKNGDIRLYWTATETNTIVVSSLTYATINEITFEFTGDNYSNVYVEVDGERVEPNDMGAYEINSSSFTIGNNNTTNVQVRIKKITITYTPDTQTSIETIDNSVKKVTYYDVQGIESSKPFDGLNIVVTEYENGTKKINKRIYKF